MLQENVSWFFMFLFWVCGHCGQSNKTCLSKVLYLNFLLFIYIELILNGIMWNMKEKKAKL
jgi:hypothetical protein